MDTDLSVGVKRFCKSQDMFSNMASLLTLVTANDPMMSETLAEVGACAGRGAAMMPKNARHQQQNSQDENHDRVRRLRFISKFA